MSYLFATMALCGCAWIAHLAYSAGIRRGYSDGYDMGRFDRQHAVWKAQEAKEPKRNRWGMFERKESVK